MGAGFIVMARLFKPIIKADPARPESETHTLQAIADTRFDLAVIRYSLIVDTIAYAAMAVLVPAPVFVLLTCLVTFGSCTSPASNSLALNMVDSAREAGRACAGLAVVGAISGILGPLLFSLVFSHTVGTYAPTVFAVAAGIIMIAQMLLMFVKLPGLPSKEDTERGRTRGVKWVKSSSIAGSSQRASS
jgi:MFS family permease